VALPEAFVARTRAYLAELERWSQAGRLTGYGDTRARLRHLVIDSLLWLAVVPEPGSPLLDIGSGAGAPGLVLKLARPGWEVVLVEAARRRANFLRHVGRLLGLEGVDVVHARAETLATGPLRGRFQTVTMRAVARPEAAGRLAAPFLRAGGVLVLALGPTGAPPAWPGARQVTVRAGTELPGGRRFLIIPGTGLAAGVPRGTGPKGAADRGREPEGRRGEDHDGREPGVRPGPGRAPHAPR
jgi:16S rRNA (guanine527-N7)-methyltransferase